MFDLTDLTGDGTPELIISPSDEVNTQCIIYTMRGVKAENIATIGSYGQFDYLPAAEAVGYAYNGDGFVIGEGSGVLVLESLEHAQARGANILAEIVGYGATCDAFHITSPAEDGSGAGEAMIIAMKEAGIKPSDVDYINAHGTSTHHNDLFETRAMKYAFKEDIRNISINSTKSMIGHVLGGAGGVELITCVKAIQDGYVHVTAGSKETEGEMDLDYTFNEPKNRDITYAMTNNLGFGGHNASIIVKKFV